MGRFILLFLLLTEVASARSGVCLALVDELISESKISKSLDKKTEASLFENQVFEIADGTKGVVSLIDNKIFVFDAKTEKTIAVSEKISEEIKFQPQIYRDHKGIDTIQLIATSKKGDFPIDLIYTARLIDGVLKVSRDVPVGFEFNFRPMMYVGRNGRVRSVRIMDNRVSGVDVVLNRRIGAASMPIPEGYKKVTAPFLSKDKDGNVQVVLSMEKDGLVFYPEGGDAHFYDLNDNVVAK